MQDLLHLKLWLPTVITRNHETAQLYPNPKTDYAAEVSDPVQIDEY